MILRFQVKLAGKKILENINSIKILIGIYGYVFDLIGLSAFKIHLIALDLAAIDKYSHTLGVRMSAEVVGLRNVDKRSFALVVIVIRSKMLEQNYLIIERILIRGVKGIDYNGKSVRYLIISVYVTELYKIYTMIHEALTPYLTEQSEIACETGMPVIRHLILAYANDVNVYNVKDQYMLGEAFLVAPVIPEVATNNTKRTVYLPEGEWLDLLSGETITVGAEGLEYKEYNKKNSLTPGQTPVFYNLNNTSEAAAEVYEEVQALLAMASAVECN